MQLKTLLKSLGGAGFPGLDPAGVKADIERVLAEEELITRTVFERKLGKAVRMGPRESALCGVPSIVLGIAEPLETTVLIMRAPVLVSGDKLATALRLTDKKLVERGWFEVGLAFDLETGALEFPTGERIRSWGTTPAHLSVPSDIAASWENGLPWTTSGEPDWTKLTFRFVLRPVLRG